MCRCVDLGSTNTSFLRVRLIGGVPRVSCVRAGASWLTLPRERGDVNYSLRRLLHQILGPRPASDPHILDFLLDRDRGRSLACRAEAGCENFPEGGERVKKKATKKKKKK